MFQEIGDILAARWDKIPDRRRPHYTPAQRYRILRVKTLLALSQQETARWFRVSRETVARWEEEATASAESETMGKLVLPEPPVRRYADVVRQLVHSMALTGFGGQLRIAQTLARAGWKLSKRTVGRILKEKPPETPAGIEALTKPGRRLQAKRPNHTFLIDLTDVSGLFGLFTFKVAVLLDVFSRMPLAARVFSGEPSSKEIAEMIRKLKPTPRHLVSDQGTQFTAVSFRDTLKRRRIRQRFGAIGKTGSIAVLERLWRTLKSMLRLRTFKPLVQRDLEQRLSLGLFYYAFLRPHQGLGGATPAEGYFGWEPARLSALAPPRGKPGEGFRISYLDSLQCLPVLMRKAA
jgi:transposase InsO family protein